MTQKAKTKPDTVTLTRFEFEELLIYSERYAIGRMSYAPQTVCDMIMSQIHGLTINTLSVLIRDITQAREDKNLGSDTIDAPVWISTLGNLKYELEMRP